MLKKRWLYWIAQCIGWIAYALVILLATYGEDPEKLDFKLVLSLTSLTLTGILITHCMRLVYVYFDWFQKSFPVLIIRVVVFSLFASILMANVHEYISEYLIYHSGKSFEWFELSLNVIAVNILIVFWNTLYFTYHFFHKSRKQELNNISLEVKKNEIELKTLKSQLNPHFLFNALNSIRALVELDPEKSKMAITTLSNLLRKSLVTGKENTISLQEELDIISNYLILEKIRFEERLEVEYRIQESTLALTLPPFSVQLMVENAIKHGISKLVAGGKVRIESNFSENEKSWTVRVVNTGEFKPNSMDGVGIVNTQRRLSLQYHQKAKFQIFQQGEEVIAEIIFEL